MHPPPLKPSLSMFADTLATPCALFELIFSAEAGAFQTDRTRPALVCEATTRGLALKMVYIYIQHPYGCVLLYSADVPNAVSLLAAASSSLRRAPHTENSIQGDAASLCWNRAKRRIHRKLRTAASTHTKQPKTNQNLQENCCATCRIEAMSKYKVCGGYNTKARVSVSTQQEQVSPWN